MSSMAPSRSRQETVLFPRLMQLNRAGVPDPEVLAEQLVVLHTGPADYTLLTVGYPDSVRKAVEALLTTHGIA
ncbi:hypothetical protein [Streptomyces fagopyri]|uniref:hypothetical protein n=1 Tax=Streptomyces fagopyri TaxID=2662397 RepID=UPI0033E6546B